MWVSEAGGSSAYEGDPDGSAIGGDRAEGAGRAEGMAAGRQCGLRKPAGVAEAGGHGGVPRAGQPRPRALAGRVHSTRLQL